MIIRAVTALMLAILLLPAGIQAAQSSKEVDFKLKGPLKVTFSHESHLKKHNNCKSCHSEIYDLSKRRSFTMVEMEKGKSCGACHNGKMAFTVAANCKTCHKSLTPPDISFKMKSNIPNADFSHKFHSAVYKCNDCHTKTFPYKAGAVHFSMADMEKGKSCGSCHNGKTAFASTGDCVKCHKGLKPGNLTFKNAKGTVVGYFKHDSHTAMFACKDCHTKIFKYSGDRKTTMKDMEKGKSCGACHDGKTGFSVKGDCAKCHRK